MEELNLCETTIVGWQTIGAIITILESLVAIIIIVTTIPVFINIIMNTKEVNISSAFITTFKKMVAGMLVFILPVVVSSIIKMLSNEETQKGFNVCEACLHDPSGATCEDAVKKYKNAREKEFKEEETETLKGDLDTCDLKIGQAGASGFTYKGNGTVVPTMTPETKKIVEKHLLDFNSSTYNSYLNRIGGFNKYADSLGGIFKKYKGKNLSGETYEDFIIASEYVFGYMIMYGFDYYNGKELQNGHYCKWGGGCLYYTDLQKYIDEDRLDEYEFPVADYDAFYPGDYRQEDALSSPKSNFDLLLQNGHLTTNCNWTVDMVLWKAGIFHEGSKHSNSSSSISSLLKAGGKVISRLCDLKPGDIMYFFKSDIVRDDPSTWGGAAHVAVVGEIDGKNNKIVVYDGGSQHQMTKNFKWSIDLTKGMEQKQIFASYNN